MRPLRPSGLGLILLVLIAGCTGPATPAVKEGAAPTASPPVVSSDTGAIAGVVLDEELRPVSRTEIALVGSSPSNATTTSDANGAFTLNGLVPGEYSLIAGRLGYESVNRRVTVIAGETSTVNLTLKALAIVVPHVEHFIDDGYIDFALTVPSVRLNPGATGPYKTSFKHNATAGAVSIVATGTWDKSTYTTATWMAIGVTLGDFRNYTEGPHPAVTTRVFEIENSKRTEFTVTFAMPFVCTDGVSCAENPPNRVAQVLYQQRTKVYTDVYYVDPATADAVAFEP